MIAAEKITGGLVDAALAYAAKGLPVFPCKPSNKRPYTEHGFKDASTDPEQIRRWWAHYPNAMVGVPTGTVTGFWALDIDDPAAFEAACPVDLPSTRRCDTGKGYHLYFKCDAAAPVANKQRKQDGSWPIPDLPGAETRGEGGYVIVPPSIHPSGRRYQWHDDATAVHAPAVLLSLVRKQKTVPTKPKAVNSNFRERVTGGSPYGLAALKAECDAIRAANDGAQEGTLNAAALKIGSLVAGGELATQTARDALIEAGEAMENFNPRDPWTTLAIERKIDSAIEAGARDPRSAPAKAGVTLGDFRAYMIMHNYIYGPTGDFWPAASVNARIPPIPLLNRDGSPKIDKKGEPVTQRAADWLDQNRAVEMVTWIPGKPQVLEDKLVKDGGWYDREGCNVFNLYRPPREIEGNPAQAQRWL